ncbi:hypothetical protein ACFY0Z_29420 [Streptomyces kronopolitis]|uniref:hypothetical protein n=1 Tax=Streptomyces kronopolitis TaxID=1612435 RepID=UPI0036B9BD4B
MDRLSDGSYFLIGGFSAQAQRLVQERFPGWTVRVESTHTMVLIAPRAAAGGEPA